MSHAGTLAQALASAEMTLRDMADELPHEHRQLVRAALTLAWLDGAGADLPLLRLALIPAPEGSDTA